MPACSGVEDAPQFSRQSISSALPKYSRRCIRGRNAGRRVGGKCALLSRRPALSRPAKRNDISLDKPGLCTFRSHDLSLITQLTAMAHASEGLARTCRDPLRCLPMQHAKRRSCMIAHMLKQSINLYLCLNCQKYAQVGQHGEGATQLLRPSAQNPGHEAPESSSAGGFASRVDQTITCSRTQA